jgi:hypothetical protein
MTWLNTMAVLLAAYLAIFWEVWFDGVRRLLGVQIDLLPALMVYSSLQGDLKMICLLASAGGLGADALSANPLGISVVPLLAVGLLIWHKREMMLREETLVQMLLGGAASVVVPALTVFLMVTLLPGQKSDPSVYSATGWPCSIEMGCGAVGLERTTLPIGWDSWLQGLVLAGGGALAAPVFFRVFGWLNQALSYPVAGQPSFRSDRQIKHGRAW